MTYMFRVFAFFALTFFSFANVAHANETECPKNIASIANDALNIAATKILKSLYEELGCSVVFIELPSRRGISHFNQGIADGEVYRLRQAETHYRRPFVRSENPLFILSNSLWINPRLKNQERYPIGYFLGVVWQENYMNNIEGKAFADSEKIYEAYNKGHLRGLLASDLSVAAELSNNRLVPPPERGEVLLEAPLYHYLDENFSPIMKRLSAMLGRSPFKNIGIEVKN